MMKTIHAYGLTTRIWKTENGTHACGECCNKDTDDECNHTYYRPNCPHCKGKGCIPEFDCVDINEFLTPDQSVIS